MKNTVFRMQWRWECEGALLQKDMVAAAIGTGGG